MDEQTKCLYCGGGIFNETTQWVQCDKCEEWIHQDCESSQQASFSGKFICKICIIEENLTDANDIRLNKNLRVSCEEFLIQLDLKEEERQALERNTRGQHLNSLWRSDRKKRVTASNFGAICRTHSVESIRNLVKNLVADKPFSTAATTHGQKYEESALLQHQSKTTVQKCGLFVHPQYPYIAGYPDGLIGKMGIIEIKCPYAIRFLEPEKATYFNKDGMLSKNHKHYYQIQGLLEVTDRVWCDYVVYTFRGIKVTRIFITYYRN